MDLTNRNILVAFFSRAGENYSNGNIVELSKGNTRIAAEMIAELCNADLFEIKSATEYPHEYRACVEIAKEEFVSNARPKLAEDKDVSVYDVVFLGYPNWCGTMPMPVWTFLENHDFSGKVIMPFCTNEGSGMGKSEGDLQKLVRDAIVKNGLSIHGSSVQDAKEDIQSWIAEE